jgi:hypothetical protein
MASEWKKRKTVKAKVPSKKPKAVKNKKLRLRRKKNQPEQIVIDREEGLVFPSEKELYQHFQSQIDQLEKIYSDNRPQDDIPESEAGDLEAHLDLTLDQPSEIWHDDKTFKEFPIFHFIRPVEELGTFHVAITYVSSDDEPTFIFLHFMTRHIELVDKFRRGDLIYDRAFEEVTFGALDGDFLTEGDPLSIGLFIAMLKVRNETDIPHDQFQEIGKELREETIEAADEIWRSQDMNGNIVVTFIKEYPDHPIKGLHYVAVTLEDQSSQVHTLLFSFPTNDETLVDRYRQGENLQAEEVVQESSH